MQATCDSQGSFTDVECKCKWPGSVCDKKVFSTSYVWQSLKRKVENFNKTYWSQTWYCSINYLHKFYTPQLLSHCVCIGWRWSKSLHVTAQTQKGKHGWTARPSIFFKYTWRGMYNKNNHRINQSQFGYILRYVNIL